MRAAPVGERAVRIAPVDADLAPVIEQARVVRGDREPGVDHAFGGVELTRRQAGAGEEPQLAHVARRGGGPLPVEGDRVVRLG